MEINRVWAMPNKWTFSIKPIGELLKKYNVGVGWFDPFAGKSHIAEFNNDLNPDLKIQFCMEAQFFTEFLLKTHGEGKFAGALFDPPYSLTQVARSYKHMGLAFKGKENPTGGFPKVRDGISKLLKKGGISISFGWNSVGMGKNRGFKQIEILLVSHGGNRNDTIVTVEEKI